MTIQNEKGEYFDLPTELEIELSRYNVLLCDMGEQTAPITLPGSPHNLKLVGYSNRIDSLLKPLTDLTVLVSDGLFVRWCNMGIHTANEEEGISCTLYFGSGEFYSKYGDKKLASINLGTYGVGNLPGRPWTLEQKVNVLINYLKSEYKAPTEDGIISVIPVITTQQYAWKKNRIISITEINNTIETPLMGEYPDGTPYQLRDEYGQLMFTTSVETTYDTETEVKNVTGNLILNGFETENETILPGINQNVYLTTFQGEKLQLVIADDTEIKLPIGYGLTPFLRVKYILSVIFSEYTLKTAALLIKFPNFNNDVVINTVADAICSGIIRYNQLVPDVTVNEFIDYCEKRYGGKFIVNEINKVVTFTNYDVITSNPDIDLTPYLTGKLKLGASDFEELSIHYNSDIEVTNKDSKIKHTTLEFDFLTRTKSTINKFFTNSAKNTFYSIDLTLCLVEVGDIIHKNTTLVTNGKTVVEQSNQPTDIKVIIVDHWSNSFFMLVNMNPVTFYPAFSSFYDIDSTPLHPDIKSFYVEYSKFKLNSNIPIEVEMDIPTNVLETLNLQFPKLLQGQPVMIESIKYTLGKHGTQTVILRTVRSFLDR